MARAWANHRQEDVFCVRRRDNRTTEEERYFLTIVSLAVPNGSLLKMHMQQIRNILSQIEKTITLTTFPSDTIRPTERAHFLKSSGTIPDPITPEVH